MSSQSMQELQDDIDELKVLIDASNRPNVSAMLRTQLGKLESQLAALNKAAAAAASAASAASAAAAPTASSAAAVTWTNISKYAFEAGDYSSKKVTIYITLPSVGSLPKDSVKVEFTKRSLDLQVLELASVNYRLLVPYLDKEIVPGECTHRISKDRITVTLKAKDSGVWSKLAGDKPAPGEKSAEDDPGASLMNMMKKMYDEGDDQMKKTIGEAMLKSRMGGGAGGPGGMGGMGDL